jgi:hypothetical protein
MRLSTLFTAISILGSPAFGHAEECEQIAIWRDGKRDGTVCRDDSARRGLVILDLSDDWVPTVLASDADTGPSYRSTYLALAQERFADAALDAELAPRDRYFELFGISPSLSAVRARLEDDARHRCHDEVDDLPVESSPVRLVEESYAQASARITRARTLRAALEADRKHQKLEDLQSLAATDAYHRNAVQRLAELDGYIAAVRRLQAHLGCDHLLIDRPVDGAYTWQTSDAVGRFQRGAMSLPTEIIDATTWDVIALGSRERDFRTALRVLREHVIAATGLIEDGSAGAGPGLVLDRRLDADETWRIRGHEPLEGAAPDLISPATEAAAQALGWRDPASTAAFLDALASGDSPMVAIPLPAVPAYHSSTIMLSVEIDRGDVWRDPVPRAREVLRRPAMILYAADGDRRIPLVRWPTTIGGWQRQNVDGDVEKRWKESPTGPRLWRDLFVGPSWLPPQSTPDQELVRGADGRYVLAREQLGPSYRAAFGMVAFVHLIQERERGVETLEDQGIRTHGTGNLTSLANGVSHGCHRLLGRNVVRLAGFILAHRDHIEHGNAPTYYRRIVRYGGRFPIAIDSLGYRIELVPPIPVDVLPGRIHR